MTIGDRIKAKRKEEGLTQIELAEKIGTTKQNLYKYENGIILNIPSDKVESIASALSTTPAYLMGWDLDSQIEEKEKNIKELELLLLNESDEEARTELENSIHFLRESLDNLQLTKMQSPTLSKEKTPTLTDKDERDIARKLDAIMEEITQGGDLMFDGDPMSEEAIESIMAAMKLGLEAAKLKNKARFTPKKYRKE